MSQRVFDGLSIIWECLKRSNKVRSRHGVVIVFDDIYGTVTSCKVEFGINR